MVTLSVFINERQKMKKILFVCLGNICRSPMAEFCMKKIVKDAGKEKEYHIESAATSAEEEGNPVYPPARRKLSEHGIDCAGKTARQIKKSDYDKFDLIIGMEVSNVRKMISFFGGDPDNKIKRLLDYSKQPHDIADPWYTGDFETSWREIEEGCRAIFSSPEMRF